MDRCWLLAFLLMSAILIGIGCRPSADLGRVSGQVTWDGQPVLNATVTFQPAQGAASYGVTDDKGWYELKQAGGEVGAVTGTHSISVETYRIYRDESGEAREHPETIPARYNTASELSHEVRPGRQTVDLALPLP